MQRLLPSNFVPDSLSVTLPMASLAIVLYGIAVCLTLCLTSLPEYLCVCGLFLVCRIIYADIPRNFGGMYPYHLSNVVCDLTLCTSSFLVYNVVCAVRFWYTRSASRISCGTRMRCSRVTCLTVCVMPFPVQGCAWPHFLSTTLCVPSFGNVQDKRLRLPAELWRAKPLSPV